MTTYTFSIVDDPLATLVSEPLGFNDLGQVVGDYADSSGVHGFLFSGGTYTPLDAPGATNGHLGVWHQQLGPDRRALHGQQQHGARFSL